MSPFVRSGSARRWSVAVGLVLVALVAPSCGGGDDQSATTTTEPSTTTTTTEPVLDAGQLQAAMLTLADLPPGWTVSPDVGDSTESGLTGDPSEFLCAEAGDELTSDRHDGAFTSFTQAETGPFLAESLASAEDADKHFDLVAAAMADCVGKSWTTTDDIGETMDFTIAEVSAPPVGERSVAYRMTGTTPAAPVSLVIDFVLVQQGRAVALFGGMNIQSPMVETAQLTPEQYAAIVATGVDKIAAVSDAS